MYADVLPYPRLLEIHKSFGTLNNIEQACTNILDRYRKVAWEKYKDTTELSRLFIFDSLHKNHIVYYLMSGPWESINGVWGPEKLYLPLALLECDIDSDTFNDLLNKVVQRNYENKIFKILTNETSE